MSAKKNEIDGMPPTKPLTSTVVGGMRNGKPRGDKNAKGTDLDRAITAMAARRTPEQIAAAQAQAIRDYPARRALPADSTLFDVIGGQWPGDESDEEVNAALSRLS